MAYKVQIVNIENNVNNILLTDDLTIELLKVRYNWILNASIKNAVLGLDDYGLVWYSGEWICGEWEDGTWYSGIFHDGIWKKGRWYSYLLNIPMVLTKRFVIIEEDKIYSQFLNGKWWTGEWHNGIFGNDNNVSGMTSTQVISESVLSPYWYNGTFYTGLFKNSVWKNGVFYNGTFKNSYWINGKFYNGYFDNYEWWSGAFYGGDFVKGDWKTGTFNQIKTDVLARFGTQSGTTSDGTLSTWENGVFENGQFMSGLNVDTSGNTIASNCHHTTHWKDGTYNNGLWYGGHFEKGSFNYGKWYGGIFNTDTSTAFTSLTIWKNGLWYDGLWINGIFKSGMFFCGMWLSGIFENGFLISEYQGSFSTDLKENVVPVILPPPPPPPFYSKPSVNTDSIGVPTYYDCVVNCTVTNNGGLITTRGVCYSSTVNIPIKEDTNSFYDTNTGIGSYSIDIFGISPNTTYYVRSFAENSLGISYGDVLNFVSELSPAPIVLTIGQYNSPSIHQMTLGGKIVNTNGTITEYGFVYSLYPNLSSMTTFVKGTSAANINYAATISGLVADTKFYWAAYAKNPNPGYGLIFSGETIATVPVVTTNTSTNITSNSVTTGGNVHNDGYPFSTLSGGYPVTERGLIYWLETQPDVVAMTINGSGVGLFSDTLSGLEPNSTYKIKAYAVNIKGTGYGAVVTFNTLQVLSVPTVITTPISNLTYNSAVSGGDVTFDGNSAINGKGIYYSWNIPIGNDFYINSLNVSTIMPFGSRIVDNPDLLSYSLYNINGVQIDSNVSKPLPFPQPDGITHHQIYYSTTPITILGSPPTGIGSYINILTNLLSSQKYYIQAFASNSLGFGYGSTIEFTTNSNPNFVPTVVTVNVTQISFDELLVDSNVTNENGSPVTTKGIGYATNYPFGDDYYMTYGGSINLLMPFGSVIVDGLNLDYYELYSENGVLINGNITKTELPIPDGITVHSPYYSKTSREMLGNPSTGIGTYTNIITDFIESTVYYFQSFAINSTGKGYGEYIEFTTNSI